MYNSKDDQKTFAVYCHYFPNGKVYVGLTCHCDDIEEKRFGHNGSKYKKQSLVYRAIQKYGWENIEHEIIANYVSRESAIEIEKDLIALYRSNEREHGYNISPGGEAGSYHSEESRKKMSESRKGKKKSEEHKRKIGEAQKGKIISQEVRKKLSESAKNRQYDSTNDPRNIAILQYSLTDGQLVGRYRSICEAARQTGASKSHISECAKDKRRQVINCVWIYENMATEEYIQHRLESARFHSLYKPVIISRHYNYQCPVYCQTIAEAAQIVGCSARDLTRIIGARSSFNGYYIKKIDVQEYLDIISK